MKLPAIAPNGLDRAIAWVAPGWARRRAHSRAILALSGGYDGARGDRAGGRFWYPSAGSADAVLQPDLPLLRRRSRDLERNNPLARGAIDTVKTSVVGAGLKPLPEIDRDYLGLSEDQAEAWERTVQREWTLFADNIECDMARQDRFAGLQSLAFRSVLRDGDAFALLRMRTRPGSPYALKIQLIEGDRVDTPPQRLRQGRIVGGVEKDDDGAPVAVWIANRHPGEYLATAPGGIAWSRVPVFGANSGRRNVLHLAERRRIGQTRGEPYLSPVIGTLQQIGRYTHAEIMAAVVNACFAITTKTEGAAGLGLTETDAEDAKGDPIELADPGAIVDLGLNETVEAFTPGRPNSAFDPFMMAMLRNIAAGLELPVELLVKHFTSSYSASRAAMLEAWRFYRERRAWLVRSFCAPVYESWLAEAVLRERIAAPGFLDDPLAARAWSGATWIGPAPGHIQPQQEARAAELRLNIGLTTLSEEIAAYSGGDWEARHRQQVKERRARERDGLLAAAPALADETDPDATDRREIEDAT